MPSWHVHVKDQESRWYMLHTTVIASVVEMEKYQRQHVELKEKKPVQTLVLRVTVNTFWHSICEFSLSNEFLHKEVLWELLIYSQSVYNVKPLTDSFGPKPRRVIFSEVFGFVLFSHMALLFSALMCKIGKRVCDAETTCVRCNVSTLRMIYIWFTFRWLLLLLCDSVVLLFGVEESSRVCSVMMETRCAALHHRRCMFPSVLWFSS